MGRLVRTRPCPCGSGRAARDCCGRFKRLSEADAAQAYLHRQARTGRELLFAFSPSGLAGLRNELEGLPPAVPALGDALFGASLTDVNRLAAAATRRPADEVAGFVRVMAGRVDSPLARVVLARVVVALREDAAIDDYLAAAALVDLDSPHSVLLCATILSGARASTARVTADRAPARWRDPAHA